MFYQLGNNLMANPFCNVNMVFDEWIMTHGDS